MKTFIIMKLNNHNVCFYVTKLIDGIDWYSLTVNRFVRSLKTVSVLNSA